MTNFTNYLTTLQLNFNNALYVSSSPLKDEIEIEILKSELFVATADAFQLADNYTLYPAVVPSQAKSAEDFQAL